MQHPTNNGVGSVEHLWTRSRYLYELADLYQVDIKTMKYLLTTPPLNTLPFHRSAKKRRLFVSGELKLIAETLGDPLNNE